MIIDNDEYIDLMEKMLLLKNIALSALGVKVTLECGYEVKLDALNRDLDAYSRRFGAFRKDSVTR